METTRFGRYNLLTRVAVGGMAEVFLARDDTPPDGRLVVVKRVLPAFAADPEFRTLFKEEMRIATSLAHRNIVPLYDAGEVDGEHYLTLEYVKGRDLATLLTTLAKTGESLSPVHAAYIASEVCEALSFAHTKGVIHRDISPGNVLLSDAGEVKLADFGIARVVNRIPLTRPDARRGKAGYLSPEQAAGETLDARSDLFGVGIILWEMLTGKRLFGASDDQDALAAARHGAIPPPSQFVKEVPEELCNITLHTLERDRSKRYASAEELGADLALFIAKESPGYRAHDLAQHITPLTPWRDPLGQSMAARSGRTRKLSPQGGNENLATLAPKEPEALEPASISSPKRLPWGAIALVAFLLLGAFILFKNLQNDSRQTIVTPSPASTSTAHALAPTQPQASPQATPLPQAQMTTGSLQVTTLPTDATLTIDGVRENGNSPFSISGLNVGKIHKLTVKAAGHETYQEKVRLKAGQLLRRSVTLEVSQGFLTINAIPFYAEVFVGDTRIGSTPIIQHALPAGTHTLRLVNQDQGVNKDVSVVIEADRTTKKIISLP